MRSAAKSVTPERAQDVLIGAGSNQVDRLQSRSVVAPFTNTGILTGDVAFQAAGGATSLAIHEDTLLTTSGDFVQSLQRYGSTLRGHTDRTVGAICSDGIQVYGYIGTRLCTLEAPRPGERTWRTAYILSLIHI